jgi:hypothetical protein
MASFCTFSQCGARHAPGPPFTIHVFLGAAKIGGVYNIGGVHGCQKCGPRNIFPALAAAQMQLTPVLLRHIEDNAGLQSLHPKNVEKYLREKLIWKVTEVRLCRTLSTQASMLNSH